VKKNITRFSIHQSSKVIAILYLVITAIIFIPMGISAIFYPPEPASEYPTAFFFIAPIIYLILSYIVMAILLFIYNLIAKGVGGIEFDLSDEEKTYVEKT
jgi:hypothetical protein